MSRLPLGRKVNQPVRRDPSVLCAIQRKPCPIPVHGYDLWRSYELSWLDEKGKPEAGILDLAYPVQSGFIVESKSLKLYLGGLSYERFSSREEMRQVIGQDLGSILKTGWLSINVADLVSPQETPSWKELGGTCLDTQDITIDTYTRTPDLLSCGQGQTEEALTSNLLKTSCPITGQPDWATVEVRYRGRVIDHASLLRYICSYRDHRGFAEEVSELIYVDLMERCSLDTLCVTCFYTRRGGIDITAHRRSDPVGQDGVEHTRLIRQ